MSIRKKVIIGIISLAVAGVVTAASTPIVINDDTVGTSIGEALIQAVRADGERARVETKVFGRNITIEMPPGDYLDLVLNIELPWLARLRGGKANAKAPTPDDLKANVGQEPFNSLWPLHVWSSKPREASPQILEFLAARDRKATLKEAPPPTVVNPAFQAVGPKNKATKPAKSGKPKKVTASTPVVTPWIIVMAREHYFIDLGFIDEIKKAVEQAGWGKFKDLEQGVLDKLTKDGIIVGEFDQRYTSFSELLGSRPATVSVRHKAYLPHQRADRATYGGIDVGQVNVNSRGGGVRTAFSDPEQLQMLLNADGLVAVVYKIQPLTVQMINMLLGL